MSLRNAADTTLRVLITGSDPALESQFRNALAGVSDTHGVQHYAETYRQAIEIARGRQPNLVVVDLDRETAEVAAFTRDLSDVAPGAAVVVVYRQDQFDQSRPDGSAFIELMRANVQDFLCQPLSATELRSVLERVLARPSVAAPDEHGRLIAFVSNKGGAGTSTLAVNVACGLALQHPDEVLLVDASLQGGSCGFMLDVAATTTLMDAVRERDRLDPTLLRQLTTKHEASGLRVLTAPGDAIEGAEIDDESLSRILHLAQRTFRYVVVDTFPSLDNIATAVLDLATLTCVVVQGLAPAVASAARLLPLLDGLGVPAGRQRILVNYNYPSFLGNLRPDDISDRLGRPVDFVVPYEKRIPPSLNTGSPQILHARWWQGFGRVVHHIVDAVDAEPVFGSAPQRAGAAAQAGAR